MGKPKTKGSPKGRESACLCVSVPQFSSFEDLAEKASSAIMAALINGGGKEFKSSVYMWLSHAILWEQTKRASHAALWEQRKRAGKCTKER
jgi:hypothetical protein